MTDYIYRPSSPNTSSKFNTAIMHFLNTAFVAVLPLISLVVSGPVQQSVRRALDPDCGEPPAKSLRLTMKWDVAPQNYRNPMADMEQPKEIKMYNKKCEVVGLSMKQSDPKGPIIITMDGQNPNTLTLTGVNPAGKPVFKYNNKDEGADLCGWNRGDGWVSWMCDFGYDP